MTICWERVVFLVWNSICRFLVIPFSSTYSRKHDDYIVCTSFVVSRFTTLPAGVGGGLRSLIVALPEDCFIVL